MVEPNADPGWDHLRTFLAVLEAGSLSAAARALGLTQPTAGRHIAALEAGLGTALFLRGPGGLTPTPAAVELKPHAEAMRAAAQALARAASGEAAELRGTVRITASQVIGAEVLPSILTAFHRRHPGIVIELALTNQTENLTRREADIAVRMTRPTQATLLAQRIGRIGVGLYAARDYLAARGTPHSPADLAQHSIIGFDRDDLGIGVFHPLGQKLRREMFALRTDSNAAQLAALRAGFGIGGCQHGLARRDGNLVPVLAGTLEFPLEMWLVMHEDLRGSRRVRLLFDHLVAGLNTYAASCAPESAAAKGPAIGRRRPTPRPAAKRRNIKV